MELTFSTERVTDCGCDNDWKKKCHTAHLIHSNIACHQVTYNPTGVMLPCSLFVKCQCPIWLLSYTVWYPQAALRDTSAVSLRAKVQTHALGQFKVKCTVLNTCLDMLRVKMSNTNLLLHEVKEIPATCSIYIYIY